MRKRAMLLLVAMATALVVGSGVALAANIYCVTDPCLGTPEADFIDPQERDTVRALAGDDLIGNGSGADNGATIYGGEGNDAVEGGFGDDTIYGGPGNDGGGFSNGVNLEGSEDSDTVYGGGGNDHIDAAANDLRGISDGEPVDRSYGQGGNDRVYAADDKEDIINCGKGEKDFAQFDRGMDTVKGCEKKIAVAP